MAWPQRKLDYADYLATPDDGQRYQVIDGSLVVTPAPSPIHQRISSRLERQLEDYFHARSLGEVLHAPIDLILTRHDILGPDILVVSDPQHVSRRGIEGPPLLVVEILSPSTRAQDRGDKARRYAELGIAHYWIVDPDERTLECYTSSEGAFRPRAEARGDVRLNHPDWAGLTIDLAQLWR